MQRSKVPFQADNTAVYKIAQGGDLRVLRLPGAGVRGNRNCLDRGAMPDHDSRILPI